MRGQGGSTSHPLRSGLIAVVGRANVGKSTLVNAVLGEKVSIVSPVAQTTRSMIRGILSEPRGQLVFLDTPGVHKASYDLGRMMNRMARASVEGVDLALLVVDGSVPPRDEDEGWIRRLLTDPASCVAAVNKMDRGTGHAADYAALWRKNAADKGLDKAAEWLPVSALKGQGVAALTAALFARAPEGPALFPEDVLTDFPRKLYMADVVREKLFLKLRDELPHAIAVEIESVEEKDDHWSATGHIYVEKSSQKGIVIGHKGRLLKEARQEAERELSELYGKPVALALWVKVEKHWKKNYWMLKKLGYAE